MVDGEEERVLSKRWGMVKKRQKMEKGREGQRTGKEGSEHQKWTTQTLTFLSETCPRHVMTPREELDKDLLR